MSATPLTLTVLDDATIRSLLIWPEVIDLIEAAFAADAQGQVAVLPVVGHSLNGGRYSIKTSHLTLNSGPETLEVFGLKLGSYFPENAAQGRSTHSAAMLLGNPRTGEPSALLAANALTEFRTAAAGAVAVRHLARPDAGPVALFGTGGQARAQLMALQAVRPLTEVRVWSRSLGRAQAFMDTLDLPGVTIRAVAEGRTACEDAALVVTVTPAESPVVQRAWIAPGTHLNAMGSDAPGKQELDAALVASARLVVDRRVQSLSIGEARQPVVEGLMRPEDLAAELGEVCAGLKPGRESDEEITVFDSTGVSFQDTALAGHLLRLAQQRGLGSTVQL